MCGIVGYVGPRDADGVLISGLRKLEYRGYDSSGIAILDGDGERFCDREADQAFFDSLREHLNPDIPVHELDNNINDPEFSARAVELMLQLIDMKDR